MSAGQKRHRVAIESPLVDSPPNTEVLEDDVPAAIRVFPVRFQASEQLGLGGVQVGVSYSVTIGYREDVTTAMVLQEKCCTQRRFQIIAVVPTDRKDDLEMTCKAGEA